MVMDLPLPFKKQSDEYFRKLHILNRILEVIQSKPTSISELSRKLNMNRSTIRYYLYMLKEENLIEYDKQQQTQGRPTLIKPNKKKAETNFKRWKGIAEQHHKKMVENPLTKKTLQVIKNNKEFASLEIVQKVQKELKIDSVAEIFSIISWLRSHKFIKETYALTQEGKQFLKENGKSSCKFKTS